MRNWLSGLALAVFAAPTLFVLYKAVTVPDLTALTRFGATVLPGYVGNTLTLSAIALALALLFGVGGAFLVAFFRFPGRRLLDVALVLPLMLPSYLVAIVYREMSHLHTWSPAVESLGGAAVILALTLYPYVYLLTRAAFRRVAMGFIEVGQSLGLNRVEIARRALLPLAMPAIMLGGLLVVVEVVSDFGTASILGVRTLTTAVHRVWFSMFDEGLAAQVALIGTLFPLALVVLYGLVTRGRGFAGPSNRPIAPRRVALGRHAGRVALAFCGVPVVAGFVWPVAIMLFWAAGAFDRFRLDSLYHDLLHTLTVAAGTTVAAVAIGLGLALAARIGDRRAWRLGTLWAVSLNYVMPAIVLAVAMLFVSGWMYGSALGGWLVDSAALIVFATTLRFTAFAYFSTENGLQGVSTRVDEALLCSGRRRLSGLLRVVLPMIRGPVVVGALLVFVVAAKELTLGLVLQPFGFRSLAMSIYYFADIDLYGPAAIYALCLVMVVAYPVLSINRWLGAR
ncbi:MAG: iron ABC transporter permease [Chromatiaceae bacterium]|nr:iron ABC transporter permease [Chromatiaceae bacterium]MCP5422744.1 iron ABC transporter permease [Chromatiaceae bacterium]